MTQIQDAYIVSPLRTPVGKAPRGMFRNVRPDDLLVHVIRGVIEANSGVDTSRIEDVIVGCAMPEGEQGLNVARNAALLAGLPDVVPGMTINRFCSSGMQAIAMAAQRVLVDRVPAMVAGGLKCPVEPDIRADIWIKLMGNVALNPLSVLTGATRCGGRRRNARASRARHRTRARLPVRRRASAFRDAGGRCHIIRARRSARPGGWGRSRRRCPAAAAGRAGP